MAESAGSGSRLYCPLALGMEVQCGAERSGVWAPHDRACILHNSSQLSFTITRESPVTFRTFFARCDGGHARREGSVLDMDYIQDKAGAKARASMGSLPLQNRDDDWGSVVVQALVPREPRSCLQVVDDVAPTPLCLLMKAITSRCQTREFSGLRTHCFPVLAAPFPIPIEPWHGEARGKAEGRQGGRRRRGRERHLRGSRPER